MEKLPLPDGMPLEKLYQRECEEVQQRPVIAPGNPDYDAFRTDILTPDNLR
ncbi:hypothetical protein [Breoghania sp.]|uniref:hypothetical protein n=1 Tax=Breoghania sp. TaxID=2065378 RepID=UPI0026311855|nr:hypothetical protein [Breoghania sp.]MDJ0931524.1 hypothetical protein [Breoghania sp.]